MAAKTADEVQSGWLERLNRLVEDAEAWARELGWSTKRVEKKMSDSEIGPYLAPALLMQEAATRIILEQIARSAPGADGLVDLYLLPAYDDIASVYCYSGRWMIHYAFADDPVVAVVEQIEPQPFTREAFAAVLKAMVENAA